MSCVGEPPSVAMGHLAATGDFRWRRSNIWNLATATGGKVLGGTGHACGVRWVFSQRWVAASDGDAPKVPIEFELRLVGPKRAGLGRPGITFRAHRSRKGWSAQRWHTVLHPCRHAPGRPPINTSEATLEIRKEGKVEQRITPWRIGRLTGHHSYTPSLPMVRQSFLGGVQRHLGSPTAFKVVVKGSFCRS